MDRRFQGKVAVVTGGASGIGRAVATAFVREGAKVVVADVLETQGQALVEALRKEGGEAVFLACDVSKAEQARALTDKALQAYGRLDVACNNAGIEGKQGMTADCDEANWDRVLAVNLKGIWLCMKYEIPAMLKQGGGAIVNMASIAGLVGFPGIPAYTASKHAVVGLTKTAALEYAKQGLRVNAVCPGVILTSMIDRFTQGDPEALKQMALGEPVGRLGKPEEIASAVLWLCAPEASFTTGQALAVDGGWVAQ